MLITGHGAIASYQARFFNKSPACGCGNPVEDRKHIIYECPQWDNVRRVYFPKNYLRSTLELLLHNQKSKTGLRTIMTHRLQASLQAIEESE
ncbi:hypothetical protein CDAR_397281 [Caerostris darwini]|uniref:Reverse transcriptase n=1 Tax=Caerostris darwini TaxID=1538125 RepID=A0AAV4PJN0_9ARAC|nr:hypothetical protein CDAR_397281 [Caerostris darwini]